MNKPLQYDDLTIDKKTLLNDFYKQLLKIIEFGNKVNYNLLRYLYGDKLATHLGLMWEKADRDVLYWFNQLDVDNRGILLVNIYYNDTLYSHC
jgi:hypothetical protein